MTSDRLRQVLRNSGPALAYVLAATLLAWLAHAPWWFVGVGVAGTIAHLVLARRRSHPPPDEPPGDT